MSAPISAASFGDTLSCGRVGSSLNPANSFTVAFWFNQDTTTPGGGEFRQYWYWGTNAANGYIYIGSGFAANNIVLEVYDGVTFFDTTSVFPVTNRWLYCSLTYDSSTHVLTLAIDGVTAGTLTINLSTITFTPIIEQLGSSHRIKSCSYRIWQTKLSNSDILEERNNYLAFKLTNLLADRPLSTINGGGATIFFRDEAGVSPAQDFGANPSVTAITAPYNAPPGVIIFNINAASFSSFTVDPGTIPNGATVTQGPWLYSLNDDGTLPLNRLIISGGQVQFFETFGSAIGHVGVKLRHDVIYGTGTQLEPRNSGQGVPYNGGILPDGSQDGWQAYPNNTTGSDALSLKLDTVDPVNLLQHRRDRVFSHQVGGRLFWINGLGFDEPGQTLTWNNFRYEIDYYYPISVPALANPPFTGGGGTSTGTIIVNKITVPSSTAGITFSFTVGGGLSPSTFSLSNGQSQEYDLVTPGTYSIIETPRPDWMVSYVTSNGSPYTAVSVSSSETVTVTVTNTSTGPFSGIYYIHPLKTNDTLFTTISGTTFFTTVVKIPNPLWKL